MFGDSRRSKSQPKTTNQPTNNELLEQSSEDVLQRGRAGQRQPKPAPPPKSAVTSFLVHSKALLESLTAWSRGNLTKASVNDAYVRMGNHLDTTMAIFQTAGLNTSELASVFYGLRLVLNDLLAEEAAPESLDKHLPYIKAALEELLPALRSKHLEYTNGSPSSSDVPPHTSSDDTVKIKPSARTSDKPHSPHRARMGNTDRHIPSEPSEVVATDHETSYPKNHSNQEASAQRTRTTQLDGTSGRSQGDSTSMPPGQRAVVRLLVSTKQLLESLTKWSEGELTESDVSDLYVRMGNNFNSTMVAFQAQGIDILDLLSIPDDLRYVLEETLAEEATPENLEIHIPKVRAIMINLLRGLRVRQDAYKSENRDPPKISGRKRGEIPNPQRLDNTNQPEPGNNTAATPTRENAYSENAALPVSSPSGREAQPASRSAYKSDDALEVSTRDGDPHTESDKALPSVSLPSVALNEPKIASQITITCEMSITEVLKHLSRHGCDDVSNQLDASKSSEYPVSSGGYGNVYRGAFHDGSSVALKCLKLPLDSTEISQKQFKRAAQEIYVWSKCIHPNILGLTGVSQYRNQLAMVSPWMPYGNLRRLLSREPGVDRYNLCTQIVDGIAYLHKTGVVHGDLKGDNILFSADLTPKLADFGNASLKEYTLRFSQTTSGAGMSLNWVAPEVLKGETGTTREADIWSLGMTMLEIMTGERPYAGIHKCSVMRRIEGGIHPTRPEADIPSQKSPLQRPNATEVQDKVGAFISEELF